MPGTRACSARMNAERLERSNDEHRQRLVGRPPLLRRGRRPPRHAREAARRLPVWRDELGARRAALADAARAHPGPILRGARLSPPVADRGARARTGTTSTSCRRWLAKPASRRGSMWRCSTKVGRSRRRRVRARELSQRDARPARGVAERSDAAAIPSGWSSTAPAAGGSGAWCRWPIRRRGVPSSTDGSRLLGPTRVRGAVRVPALAIASGRHRRPVRVQRAGARATSARGTASTSRAKHSTCRPGATCSGDYLTTLLGELRAALGRRRAGGSASARARGDVLGPPLGNATLHWREWVRRGLIDHLVIDQNSSQCPSMWHQLWPMHRGTGYVQNYLDGTGLPPLDRAPVDDVCAGHLRQPHATVRRAPVARALAAMRERDCRGNRRRRPGWSSAPSATTTPRRCARRLARGTGSSARPLAQIRNSRPTDDRRERPQHRRHLPRAAAGDRCRAARAG